MPETTRHPPAVPRPTPLRNRLALLLLASLTLGGCFSERNFPMNPDRAMTFTRSQLAPDDQPLSPRAWTARAASLAASLLPDGPHSALLTEQLAVNGQPIDIYRHFNVNPDNLDDLLANLDGLQQTAQVMSPARELDEKDTSYDPHGNTSSTSPSPEATAHPSTPASPNPSSTPHKPLTTTRNTTPVSSALATANDDTYIIITHGLFGSIDGVDMENQVNALRSAGYHVLALEMRGHGETLCRHPEAGLTFGIRESADLVAAANWLKTHRHAKRVGLVTFSLGGYEGLLTAWLNGAQPVKRFAHLPFLKDLPQPNPEPAFNAGMIIVSSPVDIIATAAKFDKPLHVLEAPLKATFQGHILKRIEAYNEPPTRTMWGLAEREFYRAGWASRYGNFASLKADLLSFLDFKAEDWEEGVRRMENVRIPVLMIHAANDPLGTAQDVADLFGRVKNPNIGVVVLPAGGHMAFTAYATDYYYTLMLNFFNPTTGPVAQDPLPLAKTP